MSTAMPPLVAEAVSWFTNPRPNGTGTMVQCPAHPDRKQSLHVSPGRDGRVLLTCHAGCTTEVILERVGKTMADLFPTPLRVSTAPRQRLISAPTHPRKQITYDYVDEAGALLYQVVREQGPDGKTFRQRRPIAGGAWEYRLGEVRRVLYRLPELRRAVERGDAVWVVEGEKDVDRLHDLGVTATTNAQGARSWRSAYAEMLRDADVYLVPDNDEPGYAHMLQVAESLQGTAARVTIVRVVGVPEKGDLSDYADLLGDDALEADLAGLADGVLDTSHPNRSAHLQIISLDELASLAGMTPAKHAYVHCADDHEEDIVLPEFPVDVFPTAIQQYIEDGAQALNVPPDMIALPLLGAAAGVIGSSCAIGVRKSWIERPILWLGTIAPPGSGKSPAQDFALAPLHAIQQTAYERYQLALAEWQQKVEDAKAAKKPVGEIHDRPTLQHFYSTDTTTEAIAAMLTTSPGIVIVRDELVGWVRSHDAYRKAGDRQNYLTLWAGGSLKVDRKGAETIFVPKPCVPIVGGIQPDMLIELAEEANRRDGFVERMLMSWPVPRRQQWLTDDIEPQTLAQVQTVFSTLRVPAPINAGDAIVWLTDEARAVFGEWYTENGALIEEASGLASGFYAKYPGQLARIALVLHCLHHPGDLSRNVDKATVEAAIEVIEYFRAHLSKILPQFSAVGTTKSAGLQPRIFRVLAKHNGEWIARRDLRRGLGNSVPAAEIDAALKLLEEAGRVESRVVETGARPRQESRVANPHNAHMRNSTAASQPPGDGDEGVIE